jgi:hypothetical protein
MRQCAIRGTKQVVAANMICKIITSYFTEAKQSFFWGEKKAKQSIVILVLPKPPEMTHVFQSACIETKNCFFVLRNRTELFDGKFRRLFRNIDVRRNERHRIQREEKK